MTGARLNHEYEPDTLRVVAGIVWRSPDALEMTHADASKVISGPLSKCAEQRRLNGRLLGTPSARFSSSQGVVLVQLPGL